MSFGLQLVAIQNIMSIWLPEDKYKYFWITLFFVVIVLFNLLNVRRYGEIEFWLTVIKIATIVGLMVLGILLPLGVSAKTRYLATGPDNTVIPCSTNTTKCLNPPGFECIISLASLSTNHM